MSNLSQFLGGGTNKATAITASGSFAQPNNVQFVNAMLVGGGSGGISGGDTAVTASGGGGGGGGGAIAFYDNIYLTGSLTAGIGAGGTSGGAGGNTTLTTNYPGSPTFTALGANVWRGFGGGAVDPYIGVYGKTNITPSAVQMFATDGAGHYGYYYSTLKSYTTLSAAQMTGFYNYTYTNQGGVIDHPYYGGGAGGTGNARYGASTEGPGSAGNYSGLGVLGGDGGAAAPINTGRYAGGGGGASIGPGGIGATSNVSGGIAGGAAPANTGGGGGGGSYNGSGSGGVGGSGGAGGTGYVMIFYVG